MNNTVKAIVGVCALVMVGLGVVKGVKPDAFSSVSIHKEKRVIKVLTGSAKFSFFQDEELTRLLEKEGVVLELRKSGSTNDDVAKIKEFDAVSPAGANVANIFAKAAGTTVMPTLFETPLVVASWKKLEPVMQKKGWVEQIDDVAYLNLRALADPLIAGVRWNELGDTNLQNLSKYVLVSTPDVRASNTGLLFLGSIAYLKNNNTALSTQQQALEYGKMLAPLLTRQGFQEGTLAGPFEDYMGAGGLGKTPMVLIYESQWVEALRQGSVDLKKQVLFYPKPSIVIKHMMVPVSESGQWLTEFLSKNEQVKQIAVKYGFRVSPQSVLADSVKPMGMKVPELEDLAEIPTADALDVFTKTLKEKLKE